VKTIRILGMSCQHCVTSVLEALSSIKGIHDVRVDLEKGTATFEHNVPVDLEIIKQHIEDAGYELGQE